MELRQLRYFLAAAEEQHFGRAAEYCQVAQPTLSVAIKTLETELGVTLFDRTRRTVTLTPEGATFQHRVHELLDGLDTAVAELSEVHHGTRGRLRVGYVSSASYTILPRAVLTFQQQLPHVALTLTPLTSAEQHTGLTNHQLDIGIVRDQAPTPELHRTHVLSEHLVAVLPAHHALAATPALTPAQLATLPLILFPQDLMPGYLSRVAELFEPVDTPLHIVQRTVHQETVLGLVAAGVGASILPASVARITMPGVVSRPITTDPTTELHLVWQGTLGPAAQVFAECVHAAASAAEPLSA